MWNTGGAPKIGTQGVLADVTLWEIKSFIEVEITTTCQKNGFEIQTTQNTTEEALEVIPFFCCAKCAYLNDSYDWFRHSVRPPTPTPPPFTYFVMGMNSFYRCLCVKSEWLQSSEFESWYLDDRLVTGSTALHTHTNPSKRL